MQAHWHVLGAGAIGCLFASALHRVGVPTTLLLRINTGQASATVRVDRDGSQLAQQLPVSTPTETGSISHLLVTTKAYDVREAVLGVAHRLEPDCQLLLLSNGMGFADELHAHLPQPAFYYGTTTEGAYRIAGQHICHAGSGLTRIGQPGTAEPPPWFSQWEQAVPASRWDRNINQALWLKLAINCAINPLTALHGCSNGELAQRPELAAQVTLVCDEIMRVSEAAGYFAATRDLHQQVAQVIADTAQNRSSMLQDVLAGRRTEIDFITGYLLAVARSHAIAAPHNEALYRRIAQLDY